MSGFLGLDVGCVARRVRGSAQGASPSSSGRGVIGSVREGRVVRSGARMAESDKSADFFLRFVGVGMTAILTGGIAGIATQDDRYFKGVAIAVVVVLLAAWLILPARLSGRLAAGYAGIGLFCFALVLFFALHAPGLLAYMLSKQLVESMPPGVQMATLLLWLLAL